MNVITLILMCVRVLLATPLAIAAWRAIDWDRPVMPVVWRGTILAGVTGGFWLATFAFVLFPAPAAEAGRRMFDTLLSVGLLAAIVYYSPRRSV